MNIPGRALVIGYGLSGRAAAHWLASHGSEVVVLEDDPEVARAAQVSVEAPGLTVQIGRGPERAEKLACSADLVVPSPGVPVGHPALVAAKAFGVDVLSEIELGWQVLDGMGSGPGRAARTCGDYGHQRQDHRHKAGGGNARFFWQGGGRRRERRVPSAGGS